MNQVTDLDRELVTVESGWHRLVVSRDEVLCAMGVVEFVLDGRVGPEELREMLSHFAQAHRTFEGEWPEGL